MGGAGPGGLSAQHSASHQAAPPPAQQLGREPPVGVSFLSPVATKQLACHLEGRQECRFKHWCEPRGVGSGDL